MKKLLFILTLLTGRLTEWDKVVPGSKLGKINVVFDHQGSSTVSYMRDSLLNGAQLGANCFAQKTPTAVFEAVEKNKNAIGRSEEHTSELQSPS